MIYMLLLLCPVCERKAKTNICEECGCVIDTSSFNVGQISTHKKFS